MDYTVLFQPFILFIGFSITAVITLFFRRYALEKGVIDIPNARSSHSVPTPRGGGISIVFVFIISLLVLLFWGGHLLQVGISTGYLPSIIVGSSLVAITGFWDDHQSIPAKWRFLIHLVSAGLSLWLLPILPQVNVLGWSVGLGILGYPFFMLVLIWLLNLYNFMDGIDGIASIEAISVLLGAVFILWVQGVDQWLFLMLLLAACIAGFLVFNWPPAKIFMGDACSGFLGFVLGLMAIMTSAEGTLTLWSWLILLGVFIVDATLTLIRRVVRGDTWHEAHRSHAYQILSRRLGSHKKVTMGVMLINTVWLLPMALASVVWPDWGIMFSLIALIPMIVYIFRLGAGISES